MLQPESDKLSLHWNYDRKDKKSKNNKERKKEGIKNY